MLLGTLLVSAIGFFIIRSKPWTPTAAVVDQVAATHGGRSHSSCFPGIFIQLASSGHHIISYLFLFVYFLFFSNIPSVVPLPLEVSRCIESMAPVDERTDGMSCPICLDVIQSADVTQRMTGYLDIWGCRVKLTKVTGFFCEDLSSKTLW